MAQPGDRATPASTSSELARATPLAIRPASWRIASPDPEQGALRSSQVV